MELRLSFFSLAEEQMDRLSGRAGCENALWGICSLKPTRNARIENYIDQYRLLVHR